MSFISISSRLFSILIAIFASQAALAEDCVEDNYEVGGAASENNDFANATSLAVGVYSDLCAENDEDWYKVESLTPGLLNITLDHPLPNNLTNGTDDLSLVIYNSNQQVIGSSLHKNTQEKITYHVAQSGDYYIRVYPTNASVGGENSYSLLMSRTIDAANDDDNENNDTLENAVHLDNYSDEIISQKAYDEDWFTSFVPAGSFTASISYTGDEELKLEAFNPVTKRRLRNTTGKNGFAYLELELAEAGDISLVVIGSTGAEYSLKIDHPIKWLSPTPTGAISGSSPAVYDIDGDGKKEIIIGSTAGLMAGTREEDPLRPAMLIALEHDGTVKWTQSFPASTSPDPVTGQTYTTTSIYSKPAIADINGDGKLEVVVSVGVDLTSIGSAVSDTGVYSPGHMGGVYALDALTGEIIWSRLSEDEIGGSDNTGDGLTDGVISSPLVCDVDQDGIPEISWGGWDRRVYLVNGADGNDFGASSLGQWPVNIHDTIWSSPLCADINDDGLHEIMIGGDITENSKAFTQTGGLFHVFDRWGREIVEGFNTPVEFVPNTGQFSFLKGKYEEQTIWSSPIAADIDNDGYLEIAYGTGLFFESPVGDYIRIWNHDGTEYQKLTTQGRTYAAPIFTDIEGDGDLEIVATTAEGWVHAWDHEGNVLFATQTYQSGASVGSNNPIYSSPLSIDLDGDGVLEILYQQGNSIVAVNSEGVQLTDNTKWGLKNHYFRGTPSIADLDGDGFPELITGGAVSGSNDLGAVYVFGVGTTEQLLEQSLDDFVSNRMGQTEFRQNNVVPISDAQIQRRAKVEEFVTRFYNNVLGRDNPDAKGLAGWTNRLLEGSNSGEDVARGFVLSREFINQDKSNTEFVQILYRSFFGQEKSITDPGVVRWVGDLDDGVPRSQVLNGFIGSQQFKNLCELYDIEHKFSETEGLGRVFVEEFVTRFYNQILQRSPDETGLANWTDRLMTGERTGDDVAKGFIGSQEFINRNLSDTEYVKVLYRSFFGRSADEGGLASWVNGLDPSTTPVLTKVQVLNGFVRSQEFKSLALEYGIQASSE